MERDDIARVAAESEETGKESLGSAATKAAPDPGPVLRQLIRWLMGTGPFPRRPHSGRPHGSHR